MYHTQTRTHTRHGSQCKAMVNWLENITDEGQHENPKLRIKAWEVLHGISELTDIFITEYLSCHLSFFFYLIIINFSFKELFFGRRNLPRNI